MKHHGNLIRQFVMLALSLCTLAITGCGEKVSQQTLAQQAFVPIQNLNAPDWVKTNGRSYAGTGDKDDKAMYAVGVANGTNNTSLLRTTAENRARLNIAKVFETYLTSMAEDYAASTTVGDSSKVSDEQHITQTMKQLTEMTLRGVSAIEYWQDPNNRDLYVLAKLDLSSMKDALDKAKSLDPEIRDYVRSNAEKQFDKLDLESNGRITP